MSWQEVNPAIPGKGAEIPRKKHVQKIINDVKGLKKNPQPPLEYNDQPKQKPKYPPFKPQPAPQPEKQPVKAPAVDIKNKTPAQIYGELIDKAALVALKFREKASEHLKKQTLNLIDEIKEALIKTKFSPENVNQLNEQIKDFQELLK